MAVVIVAPAARVDLYEIWEYVALENEDQATRLIDRFEQTFSLLAENPMMGRARNELAEAMRSFAVGSYLIFYRPLEQGIEVARVLHGSRDIEAHF